MGPCFVRTLRGGFEQRVVTEDHRVVNVGFKMKAQRFDSSSRIARTGVANLNETRERKKELRRTKSGDLKSVAGKNRRKAGHTGKIERQCEQNFWGHDSPQFRRCNRPLTYVRGS